MKIACFIILSIVLFTSCGYKIVREVDTKGNVYKTRSYSSKEKQKMYCDKLWFENQYKKTYYPNTNKITIIDSITVLSDSLTFTLPSDTTFHALFKQGIISGDAMNKASGDQYTLQMTNVETGEVTPSRKIYNYGFANIIPLYHLKTDKHHLRFWFRIYIGSGISYYYAEIENINVNRHHSLHEFVMGATLTYLEYYTSEI